MTTIPRFDVMFNEARRSFVAIDNDGNVLAELNWCDQLHHRIDTLKGAACFFYGRFVNAARDAELLARDDTAHLAWI